VARFFLPGLGLFCPKRKWVIPAGIYSGATSPGGIVPLVRKIRANVVH